MKSYNNMGLGISCQVYVSHVHSGVVMRVVMTMMSVPVHQIDSPNPSPVLDHLLFTLPLRKKNRIETKRIFVRLRTGLEC